MPEKRISCNECRFELLGACLRNPPTAIYLGGHLQAFYPPVRGMEGCFAGEPKVKKICDTSKDTGGKN